MFLKSEFDKLVYSNCALFKFAYGIYILEKSNPENPYLDAFNMDIALLAEASYFLFTSLVQSLPSINFELLIK
jgi:hypothetical protein